MKNDIVDSLMKQFKKLNIIAEHHEEEEGDNDEKTGLIKQMS
jgi:hypothetical protein